MTYREAFFRLVEQRLVLEELYSVIAVVNSVDEDTRTCVVTEVEGAALINVKLQALNSSSSGLVQIPTVGSYVIVSFLSPTDSFVSCYTDVDKILIDTDLVQFNGGDNGGLINIEDLVTKINNVEADINNLKSVFSSWVPVLQDGGTALKTASSTWSVAQLTLTQDSDIEDNKITH